METLGFELDYFDPIPNASKTIWLKLYLEDGTIELREDDKVFLKRILYPDIKANDLFLGNSVTIYGKVMMVKKYCNSATHKYMQSRESHFLCIVREASIKSLISLLHVSLKYELRVGRLKYFTEEVSSFDVNKGDIVVELVGFSASHAASFTRDLTHSPILSIHVLSSDYRSVTELMSRAGTVNVPSNAATLCIVKPHVLKSNQLPDLLQDIVDSGFSVAAMSSVHFSASMAEELLDAYKEVTPNYGDMLAHLTSAPSIALLLTGYKEDTLTEFRKCCGPYSPEVAKALRPQSLRAKYGLSSVLNAVHCSDLPEYGESECRYIFETIANSE